jgi:catechol 2,3-dioxygenase-like lactoylglutathione lyase family enzyme
MPTAFGDARLSECHPRRDEVLSESPIDVVLLATDLDASKDFYANKIGLLILNDNPEAVVFKCGGDSRLVISKSTAGTLDGQTQASFRVPDVRAETAHLRSKGVKIEDYDLPGLKTVDGIADIGFAWMAWFIDPGKNCVGMLQAK